LKRYSLEANRASENAGLFKSYTLFIRAIFTIWNFGICKLNLCHIKEVRGKFGNGLFNRCNGWKSSVKKEEGRRKKEEGRRKKEGLAFLTTNFMSFLTIFPLPLLL
jgi:hypothetical protein